MKITCPKCNASGTMPEHEIPSEGRFLSCPRCKHGFTVTKPRATDICVVDTCPACSYSTFGDETFSMCPKCGVLIKAFIARQREEQIQQKNKQLLNKKLTRDDTVSPLTEPSSAPIADFVDNLHPVNLIGWGVGVVGAMMILWGVFSLLEYHPAEIQARLAEQRDESVSATYVFFHYGLEAWVRIVYGTVSTTVAVIFIKHLKVALKLMNYVLWGGITYVVLSHIVTFIFWAIAPIPHTIGGYAIELLNTLFTSTLIGVPLFMLIQFIKNRKITSVVKI